MFLDVGLDLVHGGLIWSDNGGVIYMGKDDDDGIVGKDAIKDGVVVFGTVES